MIWAFLIAFIAAFGATSGSTHNCEEHIFDSCKADEVFPLSFPKNEEEITNTCNILIPYAECLKGYLANCGDTVAFVPSIETVLETLSEVCRKDSLLHEVIVENIACIHGVQEDFDSTCRELIHLGIEKYTLYLKGLYSNASEDEIYFYSRCFRELYQFSCFLANVLHSCGPIAKDAVLDVLKRGEMGEGLCHGDGIKGLASYMKNIETDNPEFAAMREILPQDLQ